MCYILLCMYIAYQKCSRDSSTDPKRIHGESFPFPLHFSFQKWGFSLGNSSHLCRSIGVGYANAISPLAAAAILLPFGVSVFFSSEGSLRMAK